MREDLYRVASIKPVTWQKRTVKSRRNLLLKILGLEAAFSPKLVLETLVEGKDGKLISACSGRDGRILWSGVTKLVRYPDEKRKFSQIREQVPGLRGRARLLSHLLNVLSEVGLREKAIKPLIRLAFQFYKLDHRFLKRICRKVIASLETNIIGRRQPSGNPLTVKPRLTGVEIKSKNQLLATVPLWDWVPAKKRGKW